MFPHCRCLEDAKIALKFLYNSSQDTIEKQFVGVGVEVKITDQNQSLKDALIEEIHRSA